MRGEKRTLYGDWSGGVNLEASPQLLEPNQARDALNVHTNPQGQLRKRSGFTTFKSLSFTAHSLFAANLPNKYLLAVGEGFVSISAGGTLTDITGSATLTEGLPWYIAQADPSSGGAGPIFAMNGVDTPKHWGGTGAVADWTADVGTLPNGKYLLYHANRLWCADGSTLRFSGITGLSTDTGNWDADNFVALEPEDGQEITAIAPLGPYLMVFKPRKAFVIYDAVSGANRKLSDSVGCIAHRSCVSTPQGLFFLDEEQGVMLTDGNQITHISDPVDPLIRTAASFPGRIEEAAGTYHDDSYYLSISTEGSYNDRTLQYVSGAWWIHDCASNQFALLDPVGTPILYSADPSAAQIQRAFAPNVYSSGCYWLSGYQTWGAPHLSKRVREVRIDGKGEWTLDYAADYLEEYTSDEGEVWNESEDEPVEFAPASSIGVTFAPSSSTGDIFAPITASITSRRYYTLGQAPAWSFRLTNSDSDDFQAYSMTVAITQRQD